MFQNVFLSGGGFPLCLEILQYTQCLSSEYSIVRDAGFEPGTTASEAWSANNESPQFTLQNQSHE